ncbi:MAG: hypothetical protein JXR84_18185 [Anaerolineae bacterium]|nr:hypothetical protein [Anaerolineae bacterium]
MLDALTTPAAIQAYLDNIPYAPDNRNRCPLNVLRDRRAHCLDGALFAAMALRRIGQPPVVIDLLPEPGTDDDHVLAIYKRDSYFGALAKSNYAGLRFREAVYRTLRELVMSYFEVFYNVEGAKTLRAYTRPLSLRAFDPLHWTWDDAGADAIEARLKTLRQIPVVTPSMVAHLSAVDARSYEAGMLGGNPDGLYTPKEE